MKRIRSFARRDSRMTALQARALENELPRFGLPPEQPINFTEVFSREAPCYLEIGFGSGYSLVAVAKQHPQYDFIGIETFRPGVGALLHQVATEELTNVRIYHEDAVDILEKCISDQSLHGLQIFFPDPWPKSRHHKRRLIQTDFVRLAATKLRPKGVMHLATDIEHYAKQMMKVLSAEPMLENSEGVMQFAQRSSLRPIVTKFEGRGEKEGRHIWELQFARCEN